MSTTSDETYINELALVAKQSEQRYNDFRRSLTYEKRVIVERVHHIVCTSLDPHDVYFTHTKMGDDDKYRCEWRYRECGFAVGIYEWFLHGLGGELQHVNLYTPRESNGGFTKFEHSHNVLRNDHDTIDYVMMSYVSPCLNEETIWDEDEVNKFRDKWIGWFAGMKKIRELEERYKLDIQDDIAEIQKRIDALTERNRIQFSKYQNIMKATQRGLS